MGSGLIIDLFWETEAGVSYASILAASLMNYTFENCHIIFIVSIYSVFSPSSVPTASIKTGSRAFLDPSRIFLIFKQEVQSDFDYK